MASNSPVVIVNGGSGNTGSATAFIQFMNRLNASFIEAAAQGEKLVSAFEKMRVETVQLEAELTKATASMNEFTESIKKMREAANPPPDGGPDGGPDRPNGPNGRGSRRGFFEINIVETLQAVHIAIQIVAAIKDLMQDNTPTPPEGPPAPDAIVDAAKQGAEFWQSAILGAGAKLTQMIGMAISGAMEEHQSKALLIARAGGEKIGEPLYQNIRGNAVKNGVDVNEAIKTALALMPTAQNTGQLDRMTNMAMELSALDPNGGSSEDAAGAIKSAMSGDYSGLMDQFNISEEAFQNVGFEKANDMDGFLNALDAMREKANLGAEALKTVGSSPLNQIATLQNTIKSGFAAAGMGAVEAMSPLLEKLNELVAGERFQAFFALFEQGLTFVASQLAVVGEAALWLFSQFLNNWPLILSIFMLTGAVLLPTIVTLLWSMVAPILVQAGAWLMTILPLLIIIAVIGVLIGIFLYFGGTVEQVVGFVMGLFFSLFTALKNGFAFLWNIILSVAEFLVNIFIDPVYAIKKLFFDLTKNVVDFFGGMINTFIDGLNWVLEKVNAITGTNFKMIGEIDTSKIDQFMPESEKNVVDFSKYKMGQTDLGSAFNKGSEFGTGLMDKLGSKKNDLNAMLNKESGFVKPVGETAGGFGGGTSPNINRVGEVGKINDTVDISSEDLKTMRELAEMKNIQNFVSLQPTVSVQTGDINNGYDIDTIIGRIERSLNEEIASSAEGVYA
ncbi:hypothetical protein [Bacillus sp. FJAT-26390]|uniref:hypothetical protein n=1 Tax=Bacillus sp. FJAT-26390 TaxID=1743142 RepID=UPI000807F2C8|nr:hypothetical protein [Bacillus sp. FJAT-26390]OBZ08602.1 hypothetical protein A7975_26330 [Bacillus sp. FJAT-26390]